MSWETKAFQILTEAYAGETLSSAHVSEWYMRSSGRRIGAEDDEPAKRPISVITDQNTDKILDMSGFPLASVLKLLINTTTLKYAKDFLNLDEREPILLLLKWFRKNGYSPKETSKTLVLELLPAMTAPNAEGN
ncbi:hypothetical protein TNCV_824451 [Trichonephila clavipes]|nr:hypothetical protein TNCV_824451 [Trichonephila clavipes]